MNRFSPCAKPIERRAARPLSRPSSPRRSRRPPRPPPSASEPPARSSSKMGSGGKRASSSSTRNGPPVSSSTTSSCPASWTDSAAVADATNSCAKASASADGNGSSVPRLSGTNAFPSSGRERGVTGSNEGCRPSRRRVLFMRVDVCKRCVRLRRRSAREPSARGVAVRHARRKTARHSPCSSVVVLVVVTVVGLCIVRIRRFDRERRARRALARAVAARDHVIPVSPRELPMGGLAANDDHP